MVLYCRVVDDLAALRYTPGLEATQRMREFTLRQGFNKALNTAERRLQRSRLRSKPIVIDIVVTKACNLACTFCKDYEHPGAKKIDRENFERVAEQLFPTARWVNVCSGGEPYLHTGGVTVILPTSTPSRLARLPRTANAPCVLAQTSMLPSSCHQAVSASGSM